MMREKNLRIIFWILAFLMLAAMLLISRDAGISGDEEVHYKQSELVYNYFSSHTTDKSALNTPKTYLQYYGQAFDNLVTILIHAFGIDDIYLFRHLLCSVSGWLAILVTALFAAWLTGYGAALLVLFLFAVSPTFLGHAQNNLKDIPFALAYISSIYYSLKFVFPEQKPSPKTIVLLIVSMAFAFGIRAGGILVFFYFGFFVSLKFGLEWLSGKKFPSAILKKYLAPLAGISLAAYLLGLVTWPYGLENPIVHPWKSFQIMTHYPITVRQIFEGRFIWSDFHPWYYLPKYMAITIPLVVFSGLVAFFVNVRKNFTSNQKIRVGLLGFTILFPVVFVILKHSNLYGSWRHFLFVYPGIILIAALGIQAFFDRFKQRIVQVSAIALLILLSVHPLKFMAANYPYFYLYYNQSVGGLKGAYGHYETDYYYHTMREGAEWLQEYLKNKPELEPVVVGGNFPVEWYFRDEKDIKCVYFPYPERSKYDWDYAIVANSYIPPDVLKNKTWPPRNTIHTIFADGIPVCAVVERLTKDDLQGIREFQAGNYVKSALLFQNALEKDPQNELIYTKFAETLFALGRNDEAGTMLDKCLKINPGYEPALILLGDRALKDKQVEGAAAWYEKAIRANRKQFDVYPKLAAIYAETDVPRSRKILRDCLRLNAKYIPALKAMAASYRKTSPETAKKYDGFIKKIEINTSKN